MIRHFPRKHLTALALLGAAVTAIALVPTDEPADKSAPTRAIVLDLPAPDPIIVDLPADASFELDQVAATPVEENQATDQQLASNGLIDQPLTPPQNTAMSSVSDSPDTLELQPAAQKTAQPPEQWTTLTVKSGDSMSVLFQRAGLSSSELYRITSADKDRVLYKIKPGQTIRILASNQRVDRLEYQKSRLSTWVFDGSGEKVTVDLVETPTETRLAHASGVVKGSLFYAGRDAGLSERQTMNLANIFGHVINFVYDLRKGDSFHVIYEEIYAEGEKVGEGKIIAAEFYNQGERFSAYRYEDSEGFVGFYDEDGTSMRKAFLLAPLNYSRISSNFNLARKHPVLGKIRAHKGTDYAAPTGTPIYASGDGRVSFSGNKGGYGKTVIINHNGGVQTRYAT